MSDVCSNYFGNLLLHLTLVKSGGWLALHTGDPGVLGDPTTELAGGGYIRQRILFNEASGKAVVSNNAQTFIGVPAGLITWLGIWDDQVASHLLVAKQLAAPLTPTANAHFLAAAGDVAVQL